MAFLGTTTSVEVYDEGLLASSFCLRLAKGIEEKEVSVVFLPNPESAIVAEMKAWRKKMKIVHPGFLSQFSL